MRKEIAPRHSLVAYSKKILTAALLLLSLSYSTFVNAVAIHLDFTTYVTSMNVCSYGNCTYYNIYEDPIVSDHRFSLELNNLTNTAYTDAYNNNPNFTETVNTSISYSSGAWPTDRKNTDANVIQAYTQYESGDSVISDMRVSTSLDKNYSSTDVIEQTYTGNLPPELVPGTETATRFEDGSIAFSWEDVVGSDPSFVVFDYEKLIAFYESLVGEEFDYHEHLTSYACADVDPFGYCIGPRIGQTTIYENGYAILSAATIVPVPASIWLFTSSIIGTIAVARCRKAG